jgi:lipid-A-disaccharide synthase
MAAFPPVIFPAPRSGSVDLLIIAGEHSGDEHAARLVAAARERRPTLTVSALGGPRLAAAGAQLLHDLTASSVVGVVEVLKHYRYFRNVFDETLHWITMHEPKAVCFVDYPGFNLRLAAAMRETELTRSPASRVRSLYYISPQIWAWKAGRRFTMARDLDALAVIFPFEVKTYADTNLPVSFVGHPFAESGHSLLVRHDPDGPVLLLPGSREQPVRRIFSSLLDAYAVCHEKLGRRAVVLHPSERIGGVLRQMLATRAPALKDKIDLKSQSTAGSARPEPVGASAVLTSSGTMSMQCALAGIPGAIAYRANPLTYLIGRRVITVPWLGIANLILGEPMYPEFLQGRATPAALAKELEACVGDPARREKAAAQSARLREALGRPTEGDAADWLLKQLG